jgi:phosphoribosylformimino-5-aminoimidazole carboxamide ribotide isomerase
MLIIPVIDLSRGLVVHAKQGLRDSYQPISSVISKSAEPKVVLSSFLELYPFKIIYIADLDAIQKTGTHSELILELASGYNQCEFWLDAGIKAIQEKQFKGSTNIKLILGSENKLLRDELKEFIAKNPETILSLDFFENKLIENSYLLQDTSLWPERIITMTLSKVGSNKGLDMQCINKILELGVNKEVYAAGGVRNSSDLIQLKSTKAKGVLLASALHNGVINKEDLIRFSER